MDYNALTQEISLQSAKTSEKYLAPSFGSLFCFGMGLAGLFVIPFGGTLYGLELISIIIYPLVVLLSFQKKKPDPSYKVFSILLIIMLLGFALSDLISGNSFSNISRGWARIIFLIIDFHVIWYFCADNEKNLIWLVAGIAISNFLFGQVHDEFCSMWKFSFGRGTTFLLMSVGAVILHQRLLSICVMAFGLWILIFAGARSLGAAIFLSGYISLTGKTEFSFKKKLFPIIAGVVAIVLIVSIYLAALDFITSRRKVLSDEGRFNGLKLGIQTIIRSPIIGRGSWNFLLDTNKFALDQTEIVSGGHSQILQAWVEGGILAAGFFFCLFFKSLLSTYRLYAYRPRDQLTSLFVYMFLTTAWNILMSPFGGDHRLNLALCMVLICNLDNDIMNYQKTMEKKKMLQKQQWTNGIGKI